MKAVFALLLVCLIQISFAEEKDANSGDASIDGNLSLQREVREAAKGCDKQCQRKLRQEKRKSRKNQQKRMSKKNRSKVKKSKKGKKASKKGGNRSKENTSKTKKGKKAGKKGGSMRKEKTSKKKKGKKAAKKGANGARKKLDVLKTSPTSGNGRNSSTCFTDLIAKTKKFNKAQVEFRLAKRVQSWGKLMKNKKNNSASTFSDALEAMNEATGNGKKCEGDSSSFAEAKKVREKLAKCSVTAGANCDEGNLTIPINSTQVSSCKTTLEAFAKDFKNCLVKSTDAEICSCVQGLTNPSADCLNFKAMHDGVKAQKDKCTKGSEEGSFGDCRKQERMAAKFGNKCKKACKGPSVTTPAPAANQRMKLLRRLNQKLNFQL